MCLITDKAFGIKITRIKKILVVEQEDQSILGRAVKITNPWKKEFNNMVPINIMKIVNEEDKLQPLQEEITMQVKMRLLTYQESKPRQQEVNTNSRQPEVNVNSKHQEINPILQLMNDDTYSMFQTKNIIPQPRNIIKPKIIIPRPNRQ